MFKRYLQNRLPEHNYFLFGPRQVGKSTLLQTEDPDLNINLLDPALQLSYEKNPNILKQQIDDLKKGKPAKILIDEVQRVPRLLDIVHGVIEQRPEIKFILCGSSARKLRHGASNLLGGRALYRTMHPLTLDELSDDFKLELVLPYGSLPKIYSLLIEKKNEAARDFLRAYTVTYLREEIKSEALVRNLQGFQNFLDVAVAQYSEQVNFSAVSRECQVALSTVKEYYSILEDTLLGFFLYPYFRSERKRMSRQPKFYFFDNGVTRSLSGTLRDLPGLQEQGRLFEQWIIQEIFRYNEYHQKDWKFSFWRTSHGAEVDLLISRGTKLLYAIECKFKREVSSADLSGLKSFHESHPNIQCFVVTPKDQSLWLSFARVMSLTGLLRELE